MPPVKTFFDSMYHWFIISGPKVLLGIIVFIVGQWVIKLIRKGIQRFFSAPRFNSLRPFLNGLIGVIFQVILVLAIMQMLGIKMTIFAALIAAFGVAAGLALAGTLQNFAGGVLILILKPYRVGDNIITQGQEGTVGSIRLFYTVVTTFDNKTVIVPNSKLSNEIIVNLSMQAQRRLDIELMFSYGVDFEQVKEVVIASLHQVENLLPSPAVRIGISELGKDGYKVMINIWCSAHGFLDTSLAVNEKLMTGIKHSGIKLPGM
ncbi:MAG: mechanosensitive ion channel family protein [Chitinophagaceae bacterium]